MSVVFAVAPCPSGCGQNPNPVGNQGTTDPPASGAQPPSQSPVGLIALRTDYRSIVCVISAHVGCRTSAIRLFSRAQQVAGCLQLKQSLWPQLLPAFDGTASGRLEKLVFNRCSVEMHGEEFQDVPVLYYVVQGRCCATVCAYERHLCASPIPLLEDKHS